MAYRKIVPDYCIVSGDRGLELADGYTLMNIHSYSSKADSWSWKIRHRANSTKATASGASTTGKNGTSPSASAINTPSDIIVRHENSQESSTAGGYFCGRGKHSAPQVDQVLRQEETAEGRRRKKSV